MLKQAINGLPAFIRVQREGETISQTVKTLKKAAKNKGNCSLVVVATCDAVLGYRAEPDVYLIQSTSLALAGLLRERRSPSSFPTMGRFVPKGHHAKIH